MAIAADFMLEMDEVGAVAWTNGPPPPCRCGVKVSVVVEGHRRQKVANAEYITGTIGSRSFRRPSRALNLLWDFESKRDRGGTRKRADRIGCIFSM